MALIPLQYTNQQIEDALKRQLGAARVIARETLPAVAPWETGQLIALRQDDNGENPVYPYAHNPYGDSEIVGVQSFNRAYLVAQPSTSSGFSPSIVGFSQLIGTSFFGSATTPSGNRNFTLSVQSAEDFFAPGTVDSIDGPYTAADAPVIVFSVEGTDYFYTVGYTAYVSGWGGLGSNVQVYGWNRITGGAAELLLTTWTYPGMLGDIKAVSLSDALTGSDEYEIALFRTMFSKVPSFRNHAAGIYKLQKYHPNPGGTSYELLVKFGVGGGWPEGLEDAINAINSQLNALGGVISQA